MPWINIAWEDKKYYNNTSSTSYGNPVTALVTYGPDGRPDKRSLTSLGIKHFYGDEPAAPAAQSSSKGGSKSSSKSSSSSSKSNSGGGGSSASEAAPPRPPRPLSPREIELLELDIESYEVPELHRYLPRLIEHYYNVKSLSPEIDEEIEWQSRKLKEFKNYMCSCPVPESPIEFFRTLATLEKIQMKKCAILPDDIFIQGVASATKGAFKASVSSMLSGQMKSNEEFLGEITANAPLYQRMQQIAYMPTNNCSNPLESQELLDALWDLDIKEEQPATRAYMDAAKNACKALCAKGDVPSLKKLLELSKEDRMFASTYLEKIVVPNGSKEEFMEAFTALGRYEKSNIGAVKKKFSECKNIILANYSDDAKLMEFVAAQNERELRDAASKYKTVKMLSLVVCVLLSFVTAFIPLVIWVLLFCVSAIHDKIPFLKNGKAAVAQVKEIDAKK